MTDRREFLGLSTGAALGLALPGRVLAADRPLEILFMGGTEFLGPHTVRAASSRGHQLTLFNRGRTNADLFPELETIVGDRNTADIDQLAGRRWDAVVDTSAYFPRSVDMTLDALGTGVGQYVLLSTVSVYESWSTPDADESAPVRRIADPTVEEFRQPETYGALKALCEDAANGRLPGRVTNIRPSFIVGPGDPTDRFTYWPVRLARGGEVLAPGTGEDAIQVIDARDLANWIVHCLEHEIVGTFNAHTGARQLAMADLLDSSRRALNEDAEITWVDTAFLEAHDVYPQSDLPIWLPGGMELSAERALANGLAPRPLAETVRATHAWFTGLAADRQSMLRAGLSATREADVLEAWHAVAG